MREHSRTGRWQRICRNSQTRSDWSDGVSLPRLDREIIGAAIEVHRALGPGFLESVYEAALAHELRLRGRCSLRQKTVEVAYKGIRAGSHRLDLIVEDRIIVELKTVRFIEPIHFNVVRSYMAATSLNQALILNFARMPLQIRRVYP